MDLDKIIENISVFTVRPFQTVDRHGADVVTVIAKVCWHVSPQGEVNYARPQRPVRLRAKSRTEEPWSSVLLPADMIDEKPGTDVMMHCTAYPPPGGGATHVDVALHIAREQEPVRKTVRVYGPRMFEKGGKGVVPGPATPLTPTEVTYELAAGGVDQRGEEWLIDERNPAGLGMSYEPQSLVGTPAPQLETVDGKGLAGFGPIGEGWQPRTEFGGTTDEAWMKKRAPLRPEDFDPRANCWANPDLWCEQPLSGTEPVEISGATPGGVWRFRLPDYAPTFQSTIGSETQQHETHLDTFFIDADEGHIELCWRASIALPRKMQRLKKITVREANKFPQEIRERAIAREAAEQQDDDDTAEQAGTGTGA